MQFDVGLTGLALLGAIALGFGVIAQLVPTPGTRWEWLIGAIGWFVGGLFASEVVWGSLTVEEIQPIIDNLAFDESLLGGLIGGLVAVLVARYATGGSLFGLGRSARA